MSSQLTNSPAATGEASTFTGMLAQLALIAHDGIELSWDAQLISEACWRLDGAAIQFELDGTTRSALNRIGVLCDEVVEATTAIRDQAAHASAELIRQQGALHEAHQAQPDAAKAEFFFAGPGPDRAAAGTGPAASGERRAAAVFDAVTARVGDKGREERYDVSAGLQMNYGPLGWPEQKVLAAARVLRLYRCGSWRRLHAHLRDGNNEPWTVRELPGVAPTVEDPAAHVALMDDVMNAAPLSAPVQLWRGVDNGPAIFGATWAPDMTGAEWTETSFPSTSADPNVAAGFSGAVDDVVLRLHVPAGIGAVQLSTWRTPDRHTLEAEVLLQRGLRMRVVSDQHEVIRAGGGVTYQGDQQIVWQPPPQRVLDVEVLPPQT